LGLLPALAAGDMPGADAAALWKYISQTSPYQKWGQFAELKGMRSSKAVHGTNVQIWANKPALEAKKAPLPDGSIIVKEGMGDDHKVNVVVVMYKVKGFNPEAGDWFWAKYDPDGKVGAGGKIQACISCHGGKTQNDYVLAHPFK
jgi:hypothetical protein